MMIDWTQIINEILNSDKSIKMHHISEYIGVHRTTVVNCRTFNSALRYETGVLLVDMWREKTGKLDADPPQTKSKQIKANQSKSKQIKANQSKSKQVKASQSESKQSYQKSKGKKQDLDQWQRKQ